MLPVTTIKRPAPSKTEQDALIALVLGAFLLSDRQITEMADAIYNAQVAAISAAYADVAMELSDGEDDGSDFAPDQSLLDELRAQANLTAHGIARTYQRNLRAAAAGFLAGWLSSHDNSLAGAEDALRRDLAEWCRSRAEWKALQIAQAETGEGFSVGTLAAIDDAVSGILSLAEGLTLDSVRATVLPDQAAEWFCADYAGNEYTIDEAQDLIGLFPAHLGCEHEVVVYLATT